MLDDTTVIPFVGICDGTSAKCAYLNCHDLPNIRLHRQKLFKYNSMHYWTIVRCNSFAFEKWAPDEQTNALVLFLNWWWHPVNIYHPTPHHKQRFHIYSLIFLHHTADHWCFEILHQLWNFGSSWCMMKKWSTCWKYDVTGSNPNSTLCLSSFFRLLSHLSTLRIPVQRHRFPHSWRVASRARYLWCINLNWAW